MGGGGGGFSWTGGYGQGTGKARVAPLVVHNFGISRQNILFIFCMSACLEKRNTVIFSLIMICCRISESRGVIMPDSLSIGMSIGMSVSMSRNETLSVLKSCHTLFV